MKGIRPKEQVNFVSVAGSGDYTLNFAGIAFRRLQTALSVNALVDHDNWIPDTGASSHMSSNTKILQHITKLPKDMIVHLLDGSTKFVKHVG